MIAYFNIPQSHMYPVHKHAKYEPLNSKPNIGHDVDPLIDSPPQSKLELAFHDQSLSSSLNPHIFWVILVTLLLTLINFSIYPLALSSSVRYIANSDGNLDEIGSLPDLRKAHAGNTMKNYHFVTPDRMAGVSAHTEEATFGTRSVFIGEHVSSIIAINLDRC